MLSAFAHPIVTSWARADSDPPLHALRGHPSFTILSNTRLSIDDLRAATDYMVAKIRSQEGQRLELAKRAADIQTVITTDLRFLAMAAACLGHDLCWHARRITAS